MEIKSASSREESHPKVNIYKRWNKSPFVCAYFLLSKPVENKMDRAKLVKFHFCQFTGDMDRLISKANHSD